ncbi:hypothetical protein ACETIH_28540 [Microvirga arabica]|uniref:Uncharacterized protein n=1 Tax=Microvirga arabica TaxID=1128671 RepID=A0ABV6YH61_9HYPH
MFPEPFTEEWWESTEADFQYQVEDIQFPILESREDAVNRVQAPEGSGYDPDTGSLLLGIPYLRGADRDFLSDLVAESQRLIPRLEEMFAARTVTAEFLFRLNRFNFIYGYIAAIVMFQSDDLGPERAKEASQRYAAATRTVKQQQLKWVSHMLTRQLDLHRSRKQAEHDVAKAIELYISRGKFPEDFPRVWFEQILTANGDLRSSFQQKNHTRKTPVHLPSDAARSS